MSFKLRPEIKIPVKAFAGSNQKKKIDTIYSVMGCKTFLVDDDEISVFLTKFALQVQHFSNDITTYLHPEVALADLLKNITGELPAVILLDLNMPLVSGWDFLDALTPFQQLLQASCQIFILTSSIDDADQQKSKTYSFVSGFIQKPIRPEDIQVIIAKTAKISAN